MQHIHYSKQQLLITPYKIMSRYIPQVWKFLCMGDWYHSLICYTYYLRACFFRKVVNFRFLQIFNSCFSYVRLEHRTPWFLDRNLILLTIQFCISKTVMFLCRNQRFWGLSLLITVIHICARFHFVVFRGISKPKTKKVDEFLLNTSSFFTTQHGVLFLLC